MQNDREQLLQELEAHAPVLHQLKIKGKGSPPDPAPPGYFNGLAERVLGRIKPFSGSAKPKWYRAAVTAAMILAIAGTSLWILYPDNNAETIDATDAEAWILASIDDYEPELLARLAGVRDSIDAPIQHSTHDALLQEISDEDIESLLLELHPTTD